MDLSFLEHQGSVMQCMLAAKSSYNIMFPNDKLVCSSIYCWNLYCTTMVYTIYSILYS